MMPCRADTLSSLIIGAGPIAGAAPCPRDKSRNPAEAPHVQAR